MRKSVIFILFLMVFSVVNGQVLFRYPKGQKSYNGDFYKDFHQILKEDNIKPCENKKELLYLRILVNEDSTINYIYDPNEYRIENNKCTFGVIKEVISKMKGWVPAQVDGENVKATTPIIIYLDDLFNYKEGYNPDDYIQDSDFKDYIPVFRKKVADYAYQYISRYSANGIVKVKVAFEMGEEGRIKSVFTVESSGNENFDKEFERAILDMKNKKWKPMYYRGIPINFHYEFPFTINFE